MFRYQVDHEISLHLVEHRHINELFILVDQNRQYLREWLPWVDQMQSEKDYEPVIKAWLEQFARNDGFQAGIHYDGQLVGVIGFHRIDWIDKKTELGYWLAEEFQSKGIMTRTCEALIRYAFTELKLNRVEIQCAADNHKSRAIPARLGFLEEGCLREAEYCHGRFLDLVVYGMLKKNWENRT